MILIYSSSHKQSVTLFTLSDNSYLYTSMKCNINFSTDNIYSKSSTI